MQIVNAISLSGGSAYGLDAATGVMRWLDEHHIGYPVGAAGVVPIVPAAILFDLGFGGDPKIRPTADCGYRAARPRSEAPVAGGQRRRGRGRDGREIRWRGAGGGPMKAGIGSSAIKLPNGLVVAAIVAVNAVGDIVDPATGQVVAGVRGPRTASWRTSRRLLRQGGARDGRAGENTTIGVVATNARLTKVAGAEDRADGARRLRARDRAGAHAGRRRHDLLARDGHVGRPGELRHDRRARRRGHGRRHRPRGHEGRQRRTTCRRRAIWAPCRRASSGERTDAHRSPHVPARSPGRHCWCLRRLRPVVGQAPAIGSQPASVRALRCRGR